jgi:sigma-B regulation protein RsbU (phosphoserine phosphatase)
VVFGSIRNKIFLLILITVALLAAAFFLATGHQNAQLAQLNAEISLEQRTNIAKTTEQEMTRVIRDDLLRRTDQESMITDEIFKDAKARVMLLGDYAAGLFAAPEEYSPEAWSGPDPANDGRLVAQVILADDVNPDDPKLQDAVGLIANMSDLMISVCDTFNTDNAYVALPEGAFLSVSRSAASWFNEDGSPLSYDARSRFWYKQAAEAGRLVFTDVETDANTGELSLVCALPVYGPDGELRAVIGTDLFLSSMQKTINASEKSGGYHLIVNQKGHVIVSSLKDSEFQTQTSEEAEDLRRSSNTDLAVFVNNALAGKKNVKLVHLKDGNYYMAGSPVETVGWALICVFDEDDVTAPGRALQAQYAATQDRATAGYKEKSTQSTKIMILSLAALLALLSVIALWQGKRIVRPLNTMTESISKIKGDNLEFKIEDTYRTGDEIEILANSFAEMSRKTIEYVDQVRKVTAEKERIGAELQTAATIQNSMLPHIFPPFPERDEFELYASMDPAREVGGDFYDFFLVDEDHLCMVIADVSGKGIPAALFMMVSKLILQSYALLGQSPAEILTSANDAICSNNQAGMFVTVWVGILEISTGRLTAANAGHEFPVLKRAAGDFELFKDKHGFVIGGMEGLKYKQYELQLEPGDKLFVYTDGVPEATDANLELFGTDRMLAALNEAKDQNPQKVLQGVREAVDAFVKEAEQFDDLTMLCLQYNGGKNRG